MKFGKLLLGWLLIPFFLFSSNPNDFLVKNKVLVSFEATASFEEREAILEAWFGADLIKSIHLPRPAVSIVRFRCVENDAANCFRQVFDGLSHFALVRAVSPYVLTKKGNHQGVLPEVFVKLQPSENGSRLQQLLESRNISPAVAHPHLTDVWIFSVEKNATINSYHIAVELNRLHWTVWAEPNYLLTPQAHNTNDPLYPRLWAHENTGSAAQFNGTPGADMKVPQAWTITRGDSSIRVAILDSGIDTLHEDLIANLLPGYDATGGNSNGYPNLTYSQDAHGTACAGIVAAEADNGIGIAGVAPECKIFPVRIFYYYDTLIGVIPFSTSWWMEAGITWAWMTGKADIQSNSWGVDDVTIQLLPGDPQLVNEAVTLAANQGRNGKGCIQLYSTGNENTLPIWPARRPETIAVNATSMCDERKTPGSCDGENWTGCWGGEINVGAPGVKIATTDIMGLPGYSTANYYFTFNGTSAACPNAAGVVALMLSVNPALDRHQAQTLLEQTCDKVGGYPYNTPMPSGDWSRELGYGRVNAFEAVKAAQAFSSIFPLKSKQASVSLYPNPAKRSFTLSGQAGSTLQLTVFGMDGRMLMETKAETGERISIPEYWNGGLFLVRLKSGSEIIFKKLMVY